MQASGLASGGETSFTALLGRVALLTATDVSYQRYEKRTENPVWWRERDRGDYGEAIRPVTITVDGGLKIVAGGGIIVEYEATGSFEASIAQLSQSPGLAWMGELRNDPALAGRVDWRAVEAQFDSWDYKAQGLTEAGAALVALAMALVSGGIGAALGGSFVGGIGGVAASSMGLAQGSIAHLVVQVGVNALVQRTTVALVNNRGDIGAALKELGSEDSLRSLIGAMVTAGLTAGAMQLADIELVSPAAGFGENLVRAAQENLIRAAIRVGVSTLIEGQPLDQALVSALRTAAADTLAMSLASEIGNLGLANGLKDGDISKILLHAMAGCAAGAIASGDCVAGAIGGGLQEALGAPLNQLVGDPAARVQLLALISGIGATLAGSDVFGVGVSANIAMLSYLHNTCAHGSGCYITDEQRKAAEEGNWERFYASCGAAGEYECQAAKVAGDTGFWEQWANALLRRQLEAAGSANIDADMNMIRKNIMGAYITYMDSLGATAANPVWPTHSGIHEFHYVVFSVFGANSAYWGGLFTKTGFLHILYNKCKSCK